MLDRRTFVTTAALAAAGIKGSEILNDLMTRDHLARDHDRGSAEPERVAREFYELRCYRLKPGATHTLLDSYLQSALIPALNRRGIRNVGVFTEPAATDGPAVWVLMAHRTMESIGTVNASINSDPAVVAAGASHLSTPTKDTPAFDRMDSWVFLAFAGMPRLEVPALTQGNLPRLFELRIYESYSELKALKKVAMFNAGEIELMKALHMSPVFYGQALAGRDLPQLTYLLCTADKPASVVAWDAFRAHPTWKALLADHQYDETVSKITSRFLVPTGYSQL
jgi:NIPSNAP